MNIKLFVIIVSFNSSETLITLLNQLIKEYKANIVVVENGEKEARIENIESGIKIINNRKNLGFAKGANIGIKYALANGADKILLLNPDTVIEEPIFPGLLESDKDIVSPVIKFKREDKWVYDFGGKIDWNIGRTYHLESTNYPYSSSDHDSLSGSSRSSRQAPTIGNIDYVSGCAMLVNSEVFKKIGLFDERFFLYFEDVDFCMRAKNAGFTIGLSPNAVIRHNLEEGSQKSNVKKYHLLRSNFLFINRYMGPKKIFGYLYLLGLAVKMNL